MVVIDDCEDCPYMVEWGDGACCYHPDFGGARGTPINPIPEWCELEVAEFGEEG